LIKRPVITFDFFFFIHSSRIIKYAIILQHVRYRECDIYMHNNRLQPVTRTPRDIVDMLRNEYLNKRIRHGLSKINITIKRGRRYNVVLSSTTGTAYYVTLSLLLLCAPAIPWSPATTGFRTKFYHTRSRLYYIVSVAHFLLAKNTTRLLIFCLFEKTRHDCARQMVFIVAFYIEVHCSIDLYTRY